MSASGKGPATTSRGGSGEDDQLAPLVARTEGVQPWRRVFHAGSGVAIACALFFLDPVGELALPLLAAAAAAAVSLDALRLSHRSVNRWFFRVFLPLASPREAASVASSTWYVLGVLLAVAIFPLDVAVASILVLALADPAASVAGRRWGRRRLGTGTVEGTGVFLAVSLLVLIPLAGPLAGGAAAVAATLAEPVRWPFDDNLVIPLLTGAVLWSLAPLAG